MRAALVGRFSGHHAFLVSQQLAHVDYLDEAIGVVSAQIAEALRPFVSQLARLDDIPGINRRVAEGVLAEIGADTQLFPSARHLASWVALCPGHHESAGRRKSGRRRKGNRCLQAILVEAATGAIRVANSAFAARYRRLVRHTGHKKAIVAVAHAMLVTIYHSAQPRHCLHRAGCRLLRRASGRAPHPRAVQMLERQGYRVVLERAA